jgi:hypothetical protein
MISRRPDRAGWLRELPAGFLHAKIVERHVAPGGAGMRMISCGNHDPIFARMVLGSRRVPR